MFGQEAFVNDFASTELVDVANGILKLPPLAVWGNLAIYIMAWALLMWPQHLPLGRPCIAMVFAAMACGLRELCHKAWPQEDYPTVDIFGKINPTPIALLFGLMLVNAYLKATQNERMHEGIVSNCANTVSPVDHYRIRPCQSLLRWCIRCVLLEL